MKTILKSSFTILALLFSLTSSPQLTWAARMCKSVSESTRLATTIDDDVANAQKLSDMLMTEIRTTSRKTMSQLRKQSTVYDAVIVGSSMTAAVASLVASQTGKKILVIEKTGVVASNFAEKEFDINSVETETLSMHNVPGSKINFAHITKRKYATSEQLAAYIQFIQLQSKQPVLLNTEATSFEYNNGKQIVTLRTDNGLVIRTKALLGATGPGEATTKVKGAFYRQLFFDSLNQSKLDPRALRLVMNTETMTKALKVAPKRNGKIKMVKTIALVGDGDGSRIAAEELTEKYVALPEDFKIYWIGNNYQTAQEYIDSRKGGDRYISKIVPLYEKKYVEGIEGYVSNAVILDNGQLRLFIEDPATKTIKTADVDMSVDSTGYDNVMLKVLKNDFGDIQLKDIKGALIERNQTDVTLARQIITADGKALPIYMLGSAAGPLLTKEQVSQLSNRNPISIYNNVPLTAEFTSQLFGVQPLPRDMGQRTSRPEVMSAEEIFRLLK